MEREVVARRTVQGVVVSDNNTKTIVVLVETHKRHSKYGKRVKYGKKYYAHDEKCEAHAGDTVTIMECRKLSSLKRFRLVSVDKKAVMSVKEAEAELKAEVLEAEEKQPEEKVVEVEAPKKPAARKVAKKEEKPEEKEESK